jgi:hypothetical protein
LILEFALQALRVPVLKYASPSLQEVLALFQQKNFILCQKSLRRMMLSAISITFIFHPHFGTRVEIDREKPRQTRRKQGIEKIRSGTYDPAPAKHPIIPVNFKVILSGKDGFTERMQEGWAPRK